MGKNDVQETQQEKTLSQVSIDKWNTHQQRLVPLENKVIEDANRNPLVARQKAAGAVNADMAQASAPAPINPNSGKSTSAIPALGLASKTAQAQVNAGQSVQDQHASALGNVVLMGQGKEAAATQGYETAASNATSSAINKAQIDASDRQAIGGAIGSLAGTAAAAYKPTPAGNLSDYATGSTARQAVVDGASPGPNGYSVNSKTGAITWNQ